MENGFVFRCKDDQKTLVCHKGIVYTKDRFGVSYWVDNVSLRNQGYMTEALKSLCKCLFNNTDHEIIWALPNGGYRETSIRMLEKCNFKVSDTENDLIWYGLRKDQI